MERFKICILTGLLLFLSQAQLYSQLLLFSEELIDNVAGVDGLDGSYGLTISSDNQHVYTASSTDDAVSVFELDGSDHLRFIESYSDVSKGGFIQGLQGAKRLKISPDDQHVYVPSSVSNAIVVFSRDPVTGALSYLETKTNGSGGITGIGGAYELVISPDGKHVYVAASTDDAVTVFSRDSSTGLLTFVNSYVDGAGGINGLNAARGIAVSVTGDFVYVAASTDDAVTVFSRDSSTGQLTFVTQYFDMVAGVSGLNGAYGIAISPDDEYLYVASSSSDAVVAFSRDKNTGLLTFLQSYVDDSQGGTIENLNALRYVDVSGSGDYLIVTSSSDDALTIFNRDLESGLLTFEEDHKNGINGISGLDGVRLAMFTPDDTKVLLVSASGDALVKFSANLIPLPLFLNDLIIANKEEGLAVSCEIGNVQKLGDCEWVLQRSKDHIVWEEQAKQPEQGDWSKLTFIDPSPFRGMSYYRLKVVLPNGKISYSTSKAWQGESKMLLYPNPTRDFINIDNQYDKEPVLVKIWDGAGNFYQQFIINGSGITSLDVTDFPKGTYLVQIYQDQISTHRVVIN